MYGRRGIYRVLLGRPKGKNRLEDPALDRRIILKCIFKKCYGEWTGLIWISVWTGGGNL